jgi:nucleotide-binding universal stress UspA family protein
LNRLLNKVIVGYEDTAQGRDAFALGQLLARIAEAPLEVGMVASKERGLLAARRANAQRTAERLFSQISPAPWSSGLAIGVRGLTNKSPAEALGAFAARERAELIVLGSTHRGPVGRVVLGGVAEHLLHGGPCAVAIAPRGFGRELSGLSFDELRPRVLAVGFDGGPEAETALKLAAELGLRCAATLRVITAINPTQPTPSVGHASTDRPDPQERLKAAVEALPSQLRPFAVCDRGEPSRVLLERVDQGVDLLLMGSRGAGALGRVYLGSVATDVMHEAPCPVLITPRSALAPLSVGQRSHGEVGV